jgi:hypothetical protein
MDGVRVRRRQQRSTVLKVHQERPYYSRQDRRGESEGESESESADTPMQTWKSIDV